MSHAHRASYGSISDTYRSGIPSSGGIGAHYMGAGGSTYTGAGSGGSSGGPYHSAGSGHSERVRENYYSAYRYQTYFASPQRSDLFPLLCPTGLLSAVHGLLRKPHARFGRWRTRLPPAAILVRGSIAGISCGRHLLRGRRGRRGQRSRCSVFAGAAHRHGLHQVGIPFYDTQSVKELAPSVPFPLGKFHCITRYFFFICRHLEKHGLRTVGIFRVSASKKRVRQVIYGLMNRLRLLSRGALFSS